MGALRVVTLAMAQYISQRLVYHLSQDKKLIYNQKLQFSRILGAPPTAVIGPQVSATLQNVLSSGRSSHAPSGQQASARQANATQKLNLKGASADASTLAEKFRS